MEKKGLLLKYFVLKPSIEDVFGFASIKAIRTYAAEIIEENPKFANDLLKWMSDIETEKT